MLKGKTLVFEVALENVERKDTVSTLKGETNSRVFGNMYAHQIYKLDILERVAWKKTKGDTQQLEIYLLN